MENAGRQLADKLQELGLHGPVAICCGTGNNAGDGFVLARHLDLRGVPVRVLVWGQRVCSNEFRRGRQLCDPGEKSGLPMTDRFETGHDSRLLAVRLAGAGWIVDGLLGTGARGDARPPLDAVIEELNAHRSAAKLAIDLPSGMDCDTGLAGKHTIRASHTCTFVARKQGFDAPGASLA